MKRGILIFIFVLLLIPAAYAKLSINVPEDRYNLGDKMKVSGSVYEGEAVTGYLKFSVSCGEGLFLVQIVPISIAKEKEVSFPGDISVPDITVSSAMQDKCTIMGEVVSGDKVIDRGFSTPFEITKELVGKFSLRETMIQVGSVIRIIGEVSKLDNGPVSGVADIYFRHSDMRYLADVISIEDGFFNYSYTTTATPAGSYSIDIVAHELYGNEMLFEDVASFELVNQFSIIAGINSRTLMPGGELQVSGEARDVKQEFVPSASVSVKIDETSYPTTLTDGIFSYSITLPENIKSGKHRIEISVEDDKGNTGSAIRYIDITPVPKVLKSNVPEEEVIPGTDVTLVPAIYDQADDIIDTMVEILVEGKEEVIKTTVSSGEELTFPIPQFTLPGELKVKLKAMGQEAEEKITVKEHYLLDATVEDGILTIRNIGNVKHTEKLVIGVLGEEGEDKISTRKSIKPSEEIEIDLSKELGSGTYSLYIPTGKEVKRINNVKIIEGKSRLDMTLLYYMLFIVAIILLAFLVFTGKSFRKQPPEQEYRKKPPVSPALKSALQKELESPDIEDFRKRMMDSIRETEQKQEEEPRQKSHYLKNREAEKKGGNAFNNMFG
ncbi:MAG: hypothetical protein ABIB71_08375 [Candidatus Woesearchaeota archaeon]